MDELVCVWQTSQQPELVGHTEGGVLHPVRPHQIKLDDRCLLYKMTFLKLAQQKEKKYCILEVQSAAQIHFIAF